MLEMIEQLSTDHIEQESIRRRLEIEELKLELAALRVALSRLHPDFEVETEKARQEIRINFVSDPNGN